MLLLYCILIGFVFTAAELLIIKKEYNSKKQQILSIIRTFVENALLINLSSLALMKYVLKIPNVFYTELHGPFYPIKYIALAAFIGLAVLFIKLLLEKKLEYIRTKDKRSTKTKVLCILSIIFFAFGAALFTATIWGKTTFGDITPDEFLVNLKSPIVGTSSDIIVTAFEGPVFETAFLTTLFSVIVFSPYKLVFNKFKDSSIVLLNKFIRSVICLILSVFIFIGGLSFGIVKFDLIQVYHAYVSDSSYIADNYVDPRNVKLSFPEKKRNLIHIYLESMENTYFSKEHGGYDKELMPDLLKVAKEGINFTHHDTKEKFGGPCVTVGSSWSVASMVNMENGIPLKIPMDGNSYGRSGYFLPGVIGLGDILEAQGYEQTIMFGADSDFGGLTTYFNSHGDFNIMDYKAVKEKGLIPKDYYVWWGYEDDKLYEFAKDEILRLAATGKPFHFEMETADTHFPDGYLSSKAEKKFDKPYANAIFYSQKEATKFIRWIQQQDFYENTTIVITGDHLSMDQNFFKGYDPQFRRTVVNIFLNTGLEPVQATNRQYAPFDFFPTILASMGVKIDGERLGLGTNLFSAEKTLIERDTLEKVNKQLNERSNFYNDEFISERKESVFENTNVTYY